MLTEKDYCDYDTCVALKEIGYNEKSNWWFNKFFNEDSGQMELAHISDNPAHLNYDSWGVVPKDFIIRPSLYEAQKWLREEKGVIVGIINNFTTQEFDYYVSTWAEDRCRGNEYTTYENALLRGIKEAVKILKEK